MIVVTLDSEALDYLKFVFESHCGKGLSLEELHIASHTWACVKEAKEITKDGIRSALFEGEFQPLPPSEPEVTRIQGPVSLKVNGDVSLPISAEDAEYAESMLGTP